MNGLFGAGRVVPGTGVLLPKAAQPGADNLSAAIIANSFNGTVYFAGTASGGLAAPAALTRVLLERAGGGDIDAAVAAPRSEEHTSELQSLMRISYAVFSLKKQSTHALVIHPLMLHY